MTNRKRTNKNCPAKGRLRDMADRLWSLGVRGDWAHKCAVDGRGNCDAHHLIPRQHEATRYELRNGIALCSHCHQFSPDVSPHQNAAGWLAWLEMNQPELYQWYTETLGGGGHRAFDGTKTADYYCGVIRELQQYVEPDDYKRIVGVRFSRWLDEKDSP